MQPRLTRSGAESIPLRVWWLALTLLLLGVGGLRWQSLDQRPVHTDEAENAWILANDRAGAGYVFNPEHHHGPTLNVWLRLPAALLGYQSYAEMEMLPLRAALWLAGLLSLLALAGFRPLLGEIGSLATVGVAGTSGFLSYYGNTVIHETVLGALGVCTGLMLWQWLRHPTWRWVIPLAIGVGCMLATKQTALIWFAAWAGALGFLLLWDAECRGRIAFKRRCWQLAGALPIGLAVAALLYTDGFRYPSAAGDAVRSLWAYQTSVGHEKPWSYYLTDLILPIRQAPFGSYEWLLWALAGVGMIASLIPSGRSFALPRPTRQWVWFVGISAALQHLLYAWVAYKTPWLMLGVWLHAALLAGVGAQWLLSRSMGRGRWLVGLLLLLLLGVQLRNSHLLNVVYHSDPRNPLAYAPTSANITHLPVFLEQQRRTLPPDSSIAVIGDYTWPLPWYLRRMDGVRYHSGTIARPTEAVWILTDRAYAALEPGWVDRRQLFPFSLRPNVPVYVSLPAPSNTPHE